MKRSLTILIGLLLAVMIGLLWQGGVWAGSLSAEYEGVAKRGKVFHAGHLYESPGKGVMRDSLEEFETLAGRTSFPQYVELLKHADPKVRTLALEGLFRTGGPQAFPLILSLGEDKAETFPTLEFGPIVVFPEPIFKQTVQDVARGLELEYVNTVIGIFPVWSSGCEEQVAEYWAKRKDRAVCAGWFALRLQRVQKERGVGQTLSSEIRQVRKEVDALPGSYGPLTYLWLQGEFGEKRSKEQSVEALITDEELVCKLRTVGREKLWLVLRKKNATNDPDLEFTVGNFNSWEMRSFLLEHAQELFSSDDVAEFIRMGKEQREPGCWLAAAAIDPKRESEIWQDGRAFFQEGDSAAQFLSRLFEKGEVPMGEVVEWCYAENRRWYSVRDDFLRSKHTAEAKMLVAGLLEDKRAESLSSQELADIAKQVNDWSEENVVSRDELKVMMGGFGKHSSSSPPHKAPQSVPGVLERLRASIPEWYKGNAG